MGGRIRIWVKDLNTGEVLEELGTCLTDSPRRALEMYNEDEAWTEKGYNADIAWEWVDEIKKAAQVLGRKTNPRKAAAVTDGHK
jgi:hypothetical protein